VPSHGSAIVNQKPAAVVNSSRRDAVSPQQAVTTGRIGSVSEVAAEAVRASRALSQAATQNGTLPTQPGWDAAGAGDTDLSQMEYGSLETSVKDNEIAQVASEFSEDGRKRDRKTNSAKRIKLNQIPIQSG